MAGDAPVVGAECPRGLTRSSASSRDVHVRSGERAELRRPSTADQAASAISSALFGSKRSAASPATSGNEVTFEQATGTPSEKASVTGMPQPSNLLGKIRLRSPARRGSAAGAVSTNPTKLHFVAEAELLRPPLELRVKLVEMARTDERRHLAASLADKRQRLQQTLVVLVRPGLARVEEEAVRQARGTSRVLVDLRLGRIRIRVRHRAPGDHRDLVGGRSIVVEQVAPAPRGHHHHQRPPVSQNARYQASRSSTSRTGKSSGRCRCWRSCGW